MAINEILIVDSGGANIRSLIYALQRLGYSSRLTTVGEQIANAPRLILPGVGHAGAAMRRLSSFGLLGVLRSLSQPVLGICLGMQLLFDRSAECEEELLGLIAGRVARFSSPVVPQMGWNTTAIDDPANGLLRDIAADSWFYFLHSYYVPLCSSTLASCNYGVDFSAVVQKNNFYGCQFHPERSGSAGRQLLRNFLNLPVP